MVNKLSIYLLNKTNLNITVQNIFLRKQVIRIVTLVQISRLTNKWMTINEENRRRIFKYHDSNNFVRKKLTV